MKIAVIGLGYVGAPLAVELAKFFNVVGYDINYERVQELKAGVDRTGEIEPAALKASTWNISFKREDLIGCEVFIVTVPTPIKEANVPDLSYIISATELVAAELQPGAIVVYESTVYPGVTEEVCVPILEAGSGLTWQKGFNVGYSPERINPGDKVNTLTTTTKIVAGDNSLTLDRIDLIYSRVTKTYRAPSIRVAEAAKVIENTQRDVNIALMNELTQIFSRLGIDTNDVIDAAASKWNFQAFRPGLVGGHCISVDPYYLTHKAATQGFIADVILSARQTNDSMSAFIADQLIKKMARNRMLGATPVVTILGCSFKENVPDIRNSKVFQVVSQLRQFGVFPQIFDPHVNDEEVFKEHGVKIGGELDPADAIILAVPHAEFIKDGWSSVMKFGKGPEKCLVVMDIKGVLDRARKPENVDLWRP